ncbi:MBL fold metallo-hydrolase [Bosea sp. F3-2]|uniref:MBL fold metallo-hydrolase n=1 Tax=Bosea sp. F3-2 TaxID=2599640 RepID=UPI00165665BD|nr:MBL fold metallo-hydrolase [Bosea sp. F3-2]
MTETAGLLDCSFGIRFWGTRGSIPVSGRSYDRFGGDTTCFEIRIAGRRIIVDAGSGLRRLGQAMAAAQERDATLLFSHLHLDHVIGLTAFAPLWRMRGEIAMHVPACTPGGAEAKLSALFSEPFFPVSFAQAPSRVRFSSFTAGDDPGLSGIDVATIALRHDPCAAGFRFRHGGQTLVILTDHEHAADDPDPAFIAFCQGADLLVYDAMWDEAVDYEPHRGWGHSTWQAGLRLLEAAGARRLACVHHPPELSDATLELREADLKRCHSQSFFARQDDVVVLVA